MSNDTTFTPGRWTISDEAEWQRVYGEDSGLIAEIYTDDDNEARANARLIAAAPALYEALSRVAATIESSGEREDYDYVFAALQSVKEG